MAINLCGSGFGLPSFTRGSGKASASGQLGGRATRWQSDRVISYMPPTERHRIRANPFKASRIRPLKVVQEWIYKLLDKIAPSLMVRIPRQELAEFKRLAEHLQCGSRDNQDYLLRQNYKFAQNLRDPVGRLEAIKSAGFELKKLDRATWGHIQIGPFYRGKTAPHCVYQIYYERVISPGLDIRRSACRQTHAPSRL